MCAAEKFLSLILAGSYLGRDDRQLCGAHKLSIWSLFWSDLRTFGRTPLGRSLAPFPGALPERRSVFLWRPYKMESSSADCHLSGARAWARLNFRSQRKHAWFRVLRFCFEFHLPLSRHIILFGHCTAPLCVGRVSLFLSRCCTDGRVRRSGLVLGGPHCSWNM